MNLQHIRTDIIIPCRNEAGNIATLLKQIMAILKDGDRILVVEGGSTDNTWEVINDFTKNQSEFITIKQSGKGKFNAVLDGIKKSSADYIMIWDADGTVSFTDNKKIYSYRSNEEYFITGDRLSGTREKGSMQRANYFANKLFAIWWGFLLKTAPIDSLCGSKKFPRELFTPEPVKLLEVDPYGDFTIMALARKERIKIVTFPVLYGARTYGKTNIRRWRGGLHLLRGIILITFNRNWN
jgi:glycosyltransferase involved in cell wall biosynthesis